MPAGTPQNLPLEVKAVAWENGPPRPLWERASRLSERSELSTTESEGRGRLASRIGYGRDSVWLELRER